MSTLKVNSIDSLNGVDEVSIPSLDKRMAGAWLNYDGVNNVIRGSYNVSSVVDNGVGSYRVNFENTPSDIGYTANITADQSDTNILNTDITTTGFTARTNNTSGIANDAEWVLITSFWEK